VEAAAFAAAAFAVAGFMVALTAVAFVAVAFVMVAFAAVGFTIATSSSLAILGTHSFTIPIHITDTIPTGTIPTAIILMVTDTAALAAVAFAAVAFAVVVFAVVAFAAVDDPYNQPICQGTAGYAGQLVEQIQLRLARADYYNGSIDGVERQWNTPGGPIREYKRAHGLPEGEVDPPGRFSKTGE
jgi:hypothetical protein